MSLNGHGVWLDAGSQNSGQRQPRAQATLVHHGPAEAVRKLMNKVGWRKEDVDRSEVNDAFAAIAIERL